MNKVKSNTLLIGIFIAVIVGAIIYYVNRNNSQPIPNSGVITNFADAQYGQGLPNISRPVRPPILDNRRADEVSGDLVANIVSQYTTQDRPMDGQIGSYRSSDPMSETHGSFNNYGRKRQLNMRKMEQPFSEDDDTRDFSYQLHRVREQRGLPDEDIDSESSESENNFMFKKRKWKKGSPEDIADQFNVDLMLPQETEDWWPLEPLQGTKHIKGNRLIHPKVHMGVNTVGSSLRNGTHDIRGDIPNPKIFTGIWNNSTIEPDTNIKGICNPI